MGFSFCIHRDFAKNVRDYGSLRISRLDSSCLRESRKITNVNLCRSISSKYAKSEPEPVAKAEQREVNSAEH